MRRPFHRTEFSKVQVKSYNRDESPTETRPQNPKDSFAGPNEYATTAHISGDNDFDAKLTHRMTTGDQRHRDYFRARVCSDVPVNDADPDVPEAWNGYVSDN